MLDFDVLSELPTLPSQDTVTTFDHTTFSTYLPLPFRLFFLLILGFWLCALNFHYFHLNGIAIPNLIKYTPHDNDPPLHSSIYRVSLVLSAIWLSGMLLFWRLTGGIAEEVERWGILAIATGGAVLAALTWPGAKWYGRGRTRFLRTLRRVGVGGLDRDLRFPDLLLADVITSYAKTLGDIYILLCMALLHRGGMSYSITSRPDRSCGGSFGVPFVMAIPSLIRLRQCFTDYLRTRRKGGMGRKAANIHLWNAGKYASAFPVILFSAVQREWGVGVDDGGDGSGQHILTKNVVSRLWLLCVFLNSGYSFYWDVTMDWGLTIFRSTSPSGDVVSGGEKPNHPWGLRPNRQYHSPALYYAVVILDFLLRCTWSFKLSPHLGYVNDLEGGIFMLELAELVRRWMWVFFRVEREWVGLGVREREMLVLGEVGGGGGGEEREMEGELLEKVEERERLEEWRRGGAGEEGGLV